MRHAGISLLSLGLVVCLALGNRIDGSRTPDAEAPAAQLATSQPARGGTEPGHGVRPRIFDGRMLVAYYGTVGTGALGVLGETPPEQAIARVRRAAAPFTRYGKPAQPVFELIVTVADAHPGPDGDYNHDVSHASVRRWVEAARTAGALLVLDLQTGRAPFPDVAKRWEWALREPHVGLALDPEWRMAPGQVPGRVIGSVTAAEVNRTTSWLERLTVQHGLPEKLLMLHQFRVAMVQDIAWVRDRRHLAEVQHVDGFGTPEEKLGTYRAVARPDRFRMGFKLFYDEDVRRLTAAQVKRISPRVDFVSFQ